jgi:hypothetical protein
MKFISVLDNTPANDNAGPITRLTCGRASVELAGGARMEIVVLTQRAGSRRTWGATDFKKPVAP